MYLRFADRSRYESLHLSTALEDWDMKEELKQCVTIDQYFPVIGTDEKGERYSIKRQHRVEMLPCRSEEGSPLENTFQPTLWLIVDPNLVMPCPDIYTTLPLELHMTSPYMSSTPENRTPSAVDYSTMEDSEEEAMSSSSDLCTEDDNSFITRPAHLSSMNCHVKKERVRRTGAQYKWPRPPINYCNLISVALRNSEEGSLNVQQIYSFVREQFPFFRAAPDGWKNTVRHNLCFSSSFEKSAGWESADGHRRACLWKLTRQGRRKFRTEMHALSDELLRVLRRTLMELMFGM
ncbi:forkhead box protein R1 isoform X2 [Pseudophryne corroboree]|uniref:forkhead box protein R1 isoform X2 n=1 Tax=Pseudophryne corroboree TaxID=495146 RepID=UPI003081E37D